MTHAAESTHWYTREGKPAYTVKAKAGHERPAHVGDARKLGLVPGVSGISRCAAAPALERWKTEQVLLSALTLPVIEGETLDQRMERIRTDAQLQAELARDKGSEIHAAIQGYFEGEPAGTLWPLVEGASLALCKHFDEAHEVWYAEKPFACPFGFGGKVDIHAAPRPGTAIVADFKTKEFTGADLAAKKRLAWDDHCIQLAAYRMGLGMPKARCANVFVSVNEPGLAVVHEWNEEDLERGWRMFLALLQYWQAKNKYNSSWLEQKAA